MARLNLAARGYNPVTTHEGGPAYRHMTDAQQLRRSVLACLLFEREFYEDGQAIAQRIVETAERVSPEVVAALAIEARSTFNLRHTPLLLLEVLTRTGAGRSDRLVANTISQTIQRADELAEFLAIYWHGKGGRRDCDKGHGRSMSAQTLKGLRAAFAKFKEYHFAKYDRDSVIKLKDVLRLARPKPSDDYRSGLYKRIKERTLTTPDTWEVSLSGGADKKETFERLIREEKLGYLALLRNLRNMAQAGVDPDLVNDAIRARKGGAEKVFPFRFVAAARVAPQFEPALDDSLQVCIKEMPVLKGRTIVLVDVSQSMEWKLSAKSDMKRLDAAAALGAIVNAEHLRVFTFSHSMVEVAPRRGMAGVDAIERSQPHGGTYLGAALQKLNLETKYDRIIVLTDEQTADRVPEPLGKWNYLINVASNKNGVGYGKKFTHIDGFSEGVLRYIHEIENEE